MTFPSATLDGPESDRSVEHDGPVAVAASTASGTILWRYTALDWQGGRGRGLRKRGELAAATAADVRASLRRIGLQVIEVRPMRQRRKMASGDSWTSASVNDLHAWWCNRLRAQRASSRAEFYDSLATMLGSGLPLLEAMQTIVESHANDNGRDESGPHQSAKRGGVSGARLFVTLREQLREGDSLAQAMRGHSDWFDVIDIAMVEAAQHSGTLPAVLEGLAKRQERANEISHKLLGALAYPLLVVLIGLGVVVFLSVKTLPDLTKILVDAHLKVPALTARVMWFGQALAAHWFMLAMMVAALALLSVVLPRMLARLSADAPAWASRAASRLQPPRFFRRMLVGSVVEGLSELLRSGVPMVEALRVLAPTQRSVRLRRTLNQAAERIERGEELAAALDDGRWFDAEMRRLLDIGQASGELDDMLTRIGARYQRRARRLIDRMTALLEPAVLLLLAVMVGTVVMAAILPLLALQEIIR